MRSRSNVERTSLALSVIVGLVAILAGCAKGDDRKNGFVDGEPDAAPSTGGDTFGDAGAPMDDGVECAQDNQQIYVVGTDKGFYRFYPQQLEFVRVGTLGCPTTEGTFSMAIDRRGTAWVEYTDGRIFAVDTHDATCKPTSFQAGQTGFENFGMGFALNDDDPKNGEKLYVSGAGLGTIDTKSFDLNFLGSLTYGRTELTSIGSQLYAYSVESGVVARLNKANGATEATYRTSAIESRAGFAFAHWGGSFWIFTGQSTSKVTMYSPATDESKVVLDNTGMLIVGAGSSTCAPITLPK